MTVDGKYQLTTDNVQYFTYAPCWNMNPNICPNHHPNVGKYSIDGAHGYIVLVGGIPKYLGMKIAN